MTELQHYVCEVIKRLQHPFEALPIVLEQARVHALPGREAAAVNGVLWELHEILAREPAPKPPSGCVVPFLYRG